MTQRGGKRKPGPGKRLGRPLEPNAKRIRKTVFLSEAEARALEKLEWTVSELFSTWLGQFLRGRS